MPLQHIRALAVCMFAVLLSSGAVHAASLSPAADASLDDFFTLYQPYLENISAYKPIYFLFGTEPEKSKFQLSLKYRLLNKDAAIAEKFPWTQGIHLAYTQTSFWDLRSSSKPFEDSSYKPEIFHISTNLNSGANSMPHIFFKSGLEHESNGKDEPDSRSTNIAYIQPYFIFYDRESKLGLQIAPKLWGYFDMESPSNPDLEDYRGYFDLEIKVGKENRAVLETHVRYAEKGGSVLSDLTYPLRYGMVSKNIDLYLHFQYVNALAENLLNYRTRTEAIRIGFSIIR